MSLVISSVFTYDTDAGNYIQAVEAADGQALESATRKAINDFVIGCKQDGIWDAIKASCILAGARTLAGALVPLVGTAPTNFNFVAGDYNRKTGLVGNGSTKYLDSNRAGNSDPQNSFHVSVYATTVSGIGYAIATNAAETGRVLMGIGDTANQNNRSSVTSILPATPIGPGFVGQNRSISSSFDFRRSSSTVTFAQDSQSPSTEKLLVYSRGTPGAPAVVTSSRLAFYSIGESLDLAKLDGRVTDLINKFSEVIP